MINKIFITVATFLGVLFLASLYLVFRSSDVPIPIERPVSQAVPAPAEVPQAATGTSEVYAEVMKQAGLAATAVEGARGQPYRVDLTQADGGLRAILTQVSFVLPADQSLFWRLVRGEKGLVLCGHFLKKSEAETLAEMLREAAKLAQMAEHSSPCGQDAFGVQLGAATGAAERPVLPPLPSTTPPPPVMPLPAPSPLGAGPAEAATCATANPVLEERLLRLL